MPNLNYWYRMFKYNKDFKNSVYMAVGIILMALIIWFVSNMLFPEQ